MQHDPTGDGRSRLDVDTQAVARGVTDFDVQHHHYGQRTLEFVQIGIAKEEFVEQ